jgi:hypothetical protein
MKKLKLILLTLLSVILLIGCEKIQNNQTKLVYEELSKKENYLLNLTDNKVFMYNVQNLPKDRNYEFKLIYEVYKNTEKVNEKVISSILSDNTIEKTGTERTIGINIKDDKIRFILGEDSGYSSGSCNIEEKLTSYAQSYLTRDIDLKLGTDVYIYHAVANTSSESSCLNNSILGTPINTDELNNIVKDNEENIFIKLAYNEI